MTLASAHAAAEGPHLSVLTVVTRRAAAGPEVLLVRRANPPQAGYWGFPGGKVEWGEEVGDAAIRELREEAGIEGAHPLAFDTIDLILPDLTDSHSGTAYHHLMVAVRLVWQTGQPKAGDDALEARWASPARLPQPLCGDVAQVIARALTRDP